ncbi:hypothetical protein HU200_048884 [Digitaria exilis]|uniref:Uncharacterized protein n=1 Tax=Digitaria exilis TaxID=1010633 RepID=A0A835AUX1_9POAL|nr:hypothetical protein HU200_048884 [Digitaria exilis]
MGQLATMMEYTLLWHRIPLSPMLPLMDHTGNNLQAILLSI